MHAQVPGTSEVPGTSSGSFPPPFIWDEERRTHLGAELDALYAYLYGLTHDELAYILDTFPTVRRKDKERWGELGVSLSRSLSDEAVGVGGV